ncbi:hypothetical protein B0F90DRAFT_1833249 [Multifurca ochricompacta]|uniref:glycogenin glucosyltransferase n=1 Tax=Multifurca ochricompacta TaxID=376703 RepID=A0AAD4MD33_9AGAM|nr:hypothetical protein B0F90DRAFT_1833249 [Multifurca ochricompacta]
MASPYAFVTLLTSDSYLPGALALAAALIDIHPSPALPPEVDFQTVCLVTPETVDVASIKLLRKAFDVVVGVEIIEEKNERGLQLLGRPDLSTVLTKLHIFRLIQYSKIIFLDADVLPIRPLSHLFTLPHDFSAVPDVGWPDIFNSGFMVLSPGEDKFRELMTLSKTKGSWDGADQGLLNEWRGSKWNRLSFTYNTTPTAVYTYAPAYERFGSQISAIHFIGANKPWSSIPWRAPGSSSAQQVGSQPLQVYDYSSLVDRWYAVYDKHYRSQLVIPQVAYASTRYEAVWDQGPSVTTGIPVVPATSSLSLEDLRRVAIEGFSGVGGNSRTSFASSGEGNYTSLPLEGRLDLMRPRPIPTKDHESNADAEKQQASNSGSGERLAFDDNAGSSTPKARPSSYYSAGPGHPQTYNSLMPNAPSRSTPEYPQGTSDAQIRDAQWTSTGQQPAPSQEPTRSVSPPLMAWNPAVEPPPNTVPVSNFPVSTYYPNVWDHSPSHYQSDSSPSQDTSSTLFAIPPPSRIPERLLQENHYVNVLGEPKQGETPSPDRTKIRPVFPWEDKPRMTPNRVFPSDESPPPGQFLLPAMETASLSSSPTLRFSPTQPYTSSPPSGFPPSFSYTNAWDSVPSIQKYASRLVRPPQNIPPLAPAFDFGESRRRDSALFRNYHESGESSVDGDDEDTGDEGDDGLPSKQRSRSGSSATASQPYHGGKGKKKEYRSQGVQTIPKETRNESVQVAILTDPADADHSIKDKGKRAPRSRQNSYSGVSPTLMAKERDVFPSPSVGPGSLGPENTIDSIPKLSPLGSPTGLRSPRYASPRGSSTNLAESTPRPTLYKPAQRPSTPQHGGALQRLPPPLSPGPSQVTRRLHRRVRVPRLRRRTLGQCTGRGGECGTLLEGWKFSRKDPKRCFHDS